MNYKNKIVSIVIYSLLVFPSVVFGQTPNYQHNVSATESWLGSPSSILSDGAILYTNTQIKPYFFNLAALGLVQNPAYYPQVQAWMQWYLSHFNYPSVRWGLACTIDDFNVSGTTETPTDGIIAPNGGRAGRLYDTFDTKWPNWTQLDFRDAFPWVVVSAAAALRDSVASFAATNRYINKIQSTYVDTGFPWPWYCLEAGWFIRVNHYMQGSRPL